ncbi:MAG: protein of unknown function (DUF2892) [Haloquadratum sp. J07HQX50]|nr:MAG: protein of unknown function (DUF2892) [Haloquadratum sp. J07HQX50]
MHAYEAGLSKGFLPQIVLYIMCNKMTTKCQVHVRRLAGFMIIFGLILGFFFNAYGYVLSGFVGLNLFQSSFTDICPAEWIFSKLGISCNTMAG